MGKYGKDWCPKVGQRVVLLLDIYDFSEGEIKKVVSVVKTCCLHIVTLEGCATAPRDASLLCPKHNYVFEIKQGEPATMESCCVAPVQEEYSGNAISEILEKFAPSEGGKVDKKIKELETV